MATIKDAKVIMGVKDISTVKLFLNWTVFYLHFFFWLVLIACFGIVAEF